MFANISLRDFFFFVPIFIRDTGLQFLVVSFPGFGIGVMVASYNEFGRFIYKKKRQENLLGKLDNYM